MLNGALLALLPLIAFSRAVRNSTWFIKSGISALLCGRQGGSEPWTLYTSYKQVNLTLEPFVVQVRLDIAPILRTAPKTSACAEGYSIQSFAPSDRLIDGGGIHESACHDHRGPLGLSRRRAGCRAHDGAARQRGRAFHRRHLRRRIGMDA